MFLEIVKKMLLFVSRLIGRFATINEKYFLC
jgi:hypothetical protein